MAIHKRSLIKEESEDDLRILIAVNDPCYQMKFIRISEAYGPSRDLAGNGVEVLRATKHRNL